MFVSVNPRQVSANSRSGRETCLLAIAATIDADADDAQKVLSNLKLVLGGHLILDGFEFG